MKKEVKRRAIECAAAGKRDASADFSASVSDHGFCDGQAALEQSEEKKVV